MKRLTGILAIVIALYVGLYIANPGAFTGVSALDLLNRHGYLGIITLGVAVLIVTGGIDLSIGSVVALTAVGFGVLMRSGVSPYLAVIIVLIVGAAIGLLHGLLVTRLKLQAFLVTLCGLFVYRGLARVVSGIGQGQEEVTISLATIKRLQPDFSQAIDNLRLLFVGKNERGVIDAPMEFVWMMAIAAVLAVLLHKSVYGRYWYAIGSNEQAAKYAGINTDRQRIAVFVICSTLAAFVGVLVMLDFGTLDAASDGDTFELLAITGAVLGGCSLRGGEGTIPGAVLGATVLPVIKKLNNYLSIPNTVIPIVIGLTLLLGTMLDEFLRRRARRTR